MKMTTIDLHLEFKRETSFYPPNHPHGNPNRTIEYIRWLEVIIVGPLNPVHMKGGTKTCVNCWEKNTCAFAFDDYNTDGDCLAIK
jgi:hypothetical protein